MKKQYKVISFILVLSLLFSSMIFTVGAASVRSIEDVTQNEFYEPTASFTEATSSTKESILNTVFGGAVLRSASDVTGDKCLLTYLVEGAEEGNTNSYVMLIPTAEASANGTINTDKKSDGQTAYHSQINVGTNTTLSRGGTKNYYVFEVDIATDTNLLPMRFQVVARNAAGTGTDAWGGKYVPSSKFQSLITPGQFHHVTLVGDLDSNILYVFVNNYLVDTLANGITSSAFNKEYLNGAAIRLEAMRIQMSPNESVPANSSICYDNAKERILKGDDAGNIATCITNGDLSAWSKNTNYSATPIRLPNLIEINGTKYNNTQDASAALQTYKLGTKAEVLRSCLGGAITVNCDAEITVPIGAEIDLVAGEDVDIIKGEGSLWLAVLKNFKHSAKVISKNSANITSSIRYSATDNLIHDIAQNSAVNARTFSEEEFADLVADLGLTTAEQALFTKTTTGDKIEYKLASTVVSNSSNAAFVKKFTSHSIDGSIIHTDGGNEYLIVQDNSGSVGDFPLNVHYQVNANTPLETVKQDGVYVYTSTSAEQYKIGNHDFIVFEQDIHSESEFINIYNAFNLRTPSNLPLSCKSVFSDKISTAITPEKWYHLTYVGEVASGDSYVFLNGKCVARVVGGLYDIAAIGKMAVALGIKGVNDNIDTYEATQFEGFAKELTKEEKQECIDKMVLASFRTMQIAGENYSGKDLTPDMSAASDNYYLRWADDDSTMAELIAQIDADYNNIPDGSTTSDNTIDGDYYITSWGANIYDKDYVLPEKAVIATVNGVAYYDTTSINDMLDNVDNPDNDNDYAEYTTPLQEIVLYREYIGTIHVNCRATVKINGITSNVTYGEDLIKNVTEDLVTVYKQTDTAIASVNGTLYYSVSDLNDVLNKEHEEQYTVTFLSEPAQQVTIIANAVVDYNGLTLSKVTLGNEDCVVAEGSEMSTVINLTGTTVIATMNGVNYYNNQVAELQAAVTAAKDVTISFYSAPSSPIKITSAANIKTNGIVKGSVTQDQLFTTDEINYVITTSTGAEHDYTIIKKIRTATVEVRVVKEGNVIDTVKVDGEFGTDIATLLAEKGLMSGVFVVGGEQLNVTNWDVTPSGIINKENNGTQSAYIYTATVDTAKSVEITKNYAYVTSSGVTQSDSASDVKNWFSAGGNGTIVLFADLTIDSGSVTLNGTGKNVNLNGYSINLTTMTLDINGNPTGAHGFTPGNDATVNFFGDGAINYVTNAGTQGLVFANYDFIGKLSFNGLTVNSSCAVVQARSGNFEFNGCDINSFNSKATNMFSIGEQYNGYSKNPISLTLKDCDIDFRYNDSSKVYPLINSKIVTHELIPQYDANNKLTGYATGNPIADVVRTVIIDGCTIKSQGALVAAYECQNSTLTPNAYLQSNLKLYVNDSSIMAQSITTGLIKANTIFFCDDVRTNVQNTDNIAFANDLVSAKVSDGLYSVLYTSHDYAAITWSTGVTEYWAGGSTPNSYEHRFDGITAGGIGADQENSSYESTGTNFPFGLLANLTLSDMIGFNVYIPTQFKAQTKVYLDGKEIQPNKYANGEERVTVVAAASGYGNGGRCYDYTLTLAPQEAAKSFTIVIVCGDKCVSRTVSVADYAASLIKNGTNNDEKNLALLSVTLAYIEQATKFSGNTVDLSKIQALRTELGTKTATIAAPTAPTVTHEETKADFAKHFSGVSINVKESGAFRFRLADGVSADGFAFYIANDKNDGYELREHKVVTVGKNTYLELSLRAFEMARSIKITKGGEYDLYSLYRCYDATKTLANSTLDVSGVAYVTGITYEYKASLTLIETIYHYASICDKYLDKNAAEYQPAN